MRKEIEKELNKIALEATGFDISGIEDFKTPDEAISHHATWIRDHAEECAGIFESETNKYL